MKKILLPLLLVVALMFSTVAYATNEPVQHIHLDGESDAALSADVCINLCGIMTFKGYYYYKGELAGREYYCQVCGYSYIVYE